MTEDQHFSIGLQIISDLQANTKHITVILKCIFVLCTNREVVISNIYFMWLFLLLFSNGLVSNGLLISQFVHRQEFPR